MGHVGQKLCQILEKPYVCFRGHIFRPIIMKQDKMFVLIKSQTGLKMRHIGSKTRSLDQILEKPCVRSIGHILSLITMKFDQHVCFYEISHIVENGSCLVKN